MPRKIALKTDIIEATRRGMKADPKNYRKGARAAGIGRASYAFIRKLLIMEPKVTDPGHREVIVGALRSVNEDRNIRRAIRETKEVIGQYWKPRSQYPIWHVRIHGRPGRLNHHQRPNGGGHHLEAKFERAILGIGINCDCDDVVIPVGLSLKEVRAALRTVAEGRSSLRKFGSRLRSLKEAMEREEAAEKEALALETSSRDCREEAA